MRLINGRIPVDIHPFFWLLILAIGWLNTFTIIGTVVWAAIIFFSVLVHEYGHALTARTFGQEARIDLVGFGGLTTRRGPKLKLWQEFIIVLNGPLAGFGLFLLAYGIRLLLGPDQPVTLFLYALTVTIYVNLFWTVVNLLPIQPLDGGRLLVIVLEGMFGLHGVKVALFVSVVLAALISFAFFSIGAFIAGALFLILMFEGYRNWKGSLALTSQDQDTALQDLFKSADRSMQKGEWVEARAKLEKVRQQAQRGVIYQAATEQLGDVLCQQGEFREAYRVLDEGRAKLSPAGLRLLHQAAYQSGEWQEAVSLGKRAYQDYPTHETALINALSHSLLGEAKPAVGWIQCAVKDGLPNIGKVLQRSEFNAIRNDELFQQLEKGAGGS